ncbi:MAG: HD family hydrolase [Acidobacteria bacterium]|jgi:putative hydrolases of HD superfamily|nr:HD family hydrolase [Acidobacteriota bacterium]
MREETQAAVEFLSEVVRLKAVPRQGWLLRGVRDVESVAAHSFGVALTAMLLADLARRQGMVVDVERTLRMALLHDLAEVRTGDLPSTIKPYFDPGTMRRAEEGVATDLLGPLGQLGDHWYELWREYEDRRTLEARLVKAADKLDLLVQASEYEQGGARALDEFWRNAEDDFARLELGELVADLLSILRANRRS